MIIVTNKPYRAALIDTLLLMDSGVEGSPYLYVSSNVFEQAIRLAARFDSDPAIMAKTAGITPNADLKESIIYYRKMMPYPINMLAPFLNLLTEIKEIPTLQDAYGALHIMSLMIDFNAFTLCDASIRSNVVFPKVMIENYRSSWDTCTDDIKDKIAEVFPDVTDSSYVAPAVLKEIETVNDYEDQASNVIGDIFANLFDDDEEDEDNSYESVKSESKDDSDILAKKDEDEETKRILSQYAGI